jgi:hypothetical protein
MQQQILLAAGLSAAIAGCGERPTAYDAVLSQADDARAAIVGAGSGGDFEAALLCDAAARLGDPDWPPLAAWIVLPERGETFGFAGRGVAIVDGRKVPVRLSLKIDGREIELAGLKVRRDEQLQRAVLVGAVKHGDRLAGRIEKAKTFEFAGDGRRLRIDVRGMDDLKAIAGICGAVAAASSPPAARGDDAASLATSLSNEEIAAAIVGGWRSGSATFEKNGMRYRIVTAESPAPPADAQARGIKAMPGLGIEGDGAPFASVIAGFAVFDDPAAADAYYSDLDFNLGEQEVAEIKSFYIRRDGYPEEYMNCVFVPDAGNSINCHYQTADKRIVAVLLFADGPALDFSGNERAIDLVFADEAALDRVSLVASATWAYLYDAVYR